MIFETKSKFLISFVAKSSSSFDHDLALLKRVISLIGCSLPSIFSYFYSIIERVVRIARELDASVKWKT